jgi:hypothetical protein
MDPPQHLFSVGRGRQIVLIFENRILKDRADVGPEVGVLPVEQGLHRLHVERGLRRRRAGFRALPKQVSDQLFPIDPESVLDVFEGPAGRRRRPVAPCSGHRHTELSQRTSLVDRRVGGGSS